MRTGQQQTPPQLTALFTLGRGRARAVPAPDRSGWYVVQLENAVPGSAIAAPDLVENTRGQFGPVLGQEYGAQLAAAARRTVGVEINGAAVARLKSELVGGTAGQ
jgi:peptidyl-prolyl cis-trans isomerase D